MSRPSRLLRLAPLLAISLAISACETPYTSMYSPRLTHYEKPPERAGASAEDLLGAPQVEAPSSVAIPAPGALDPDLPAAPIEMAPEPVPPLDGGAIPGL